MTVIERLDDLGHVLLDDLIGRDFGELRVVDGHTDVRHDPDDQLNLFVTLALSEPRGGAGWRAGDLKAVRAAFRDLLLSQGTDLVPYLQFTSEGDIGQLRGLVQPEG